MVRLRRLAFKGVREPREHSAKRVRNCNDEEHVMVERHQQTKKSTDKNKDLERMPIAQVQVFKTVKAPRAHHEKADGDQQRKPYRRELRPQNWISTHQVDSRSNNAGPGRNGQADKIFSSRAPRIGRLWI